MPYIHDIDQDWGVFECDFPNCLNQAGFDGTDSQCRKQARLAGWRIKNSIDGPLVVCPDCFEENQF